ncbi:MAG: hypothetical protein M0P69_15135 [Bacteroidales bacterium]|nr:hypothetical protein [Bacteroidales bacterium]
MELLIKRTDGTIDWVDIGEGVTLGLIANSYGRGTELLAVFQKESPREGDSEKT